MRLPSRRYLLPVSIWILTFIAYRLYATTGSWTQDADGNWQVNGNWNGTAFPNGASDDAFFINSISADHSYDLGGAINVGGITFSNVNNQVVITNTSGGTLTLNRVGAGTTNLTENGSGDVVIRGLKISSGTNVWAGIGTGRVTLQGPAVDETGAGGTIEKQGSFILRISTPLTISGSFIFDSGTVIMNNSSAFGSVSNIVMNGGTLKGFSATDVKTITNLFTVNGDYTLSVGAMISNTGPLVLGSTTHTVTISVNTNVWSGVVSGSGGISKAGTGVLDLSGNNTFSGNVTNSAGTIIVDSANALGTTSSISVKGGTLLFNTGYTNTGAEVVLSGGTIQEVDKNTKLGRLTLTANSSIILAPGGSTGIHMDFATATNTVGSGAVLTVYNWGGTGSGGDDDLIFFSSSSGVTSSFLNNVTFFGLGPGARILSSGELVPITPEPSTILSGMFLMSVLLHRTRPFKNKFFGKADPKHKG